MKLSAPLLLAMSAMSCPPSRIWAMGLPPNILTHTSHSQQQTQPTKKVFGTTQHDLNNTQSLWIGNPKGSLNTAIPSPQMLYKMLVQELHTPHPSTSPRKALFLSLDLNPHQNPQSPTTTICFRIVFSTAFLGPKQNDVKTMGNQFIISQTRFFCVNTNNCPREERPLGSASTFF